MSEKLKIVPITQKKANLFVRELHRHHRMVSGSVFQLACAHGDVIVGVAIVGRPCSRLLQDGFTLEVNRLCTDGTKNACSMLYSAAWRVAKELGYKRLITYILGSETGVSLRAANWNLVGSTGGGSWSRPSRKRVDAHPVERKQRFEVLIN